MKKIAVTLSTAALLFFAACADDNSKNDGGDQLDDPVMNSGANTEGERATEAVSDSANADRDSSVRRNEDAMSAPH